MKSRTIALALVLIIGISLTVVFFYNDFFKTQPVREYRTNITMENPYNADEEVAQALAQLKKSQEKATIVKGDKSGFRHIALTFDGLTDRTTIQQILGLLKKYNVKATFFADGLQAIEDPETLTDIKNAGQRIENYTLLGMDKMEAVPVERLVNDFCRAKKIIKVNTDQGPNLLKCNDTKYTDQVLQVAKACGFSSVVQSDIFLNVKQINALNGADAFVATIRPGSIVSAKLKANIEPIATEQGKTDLKPAIDKQPGLKEMPQQAGLGEKEIVEAVEKLLIALQKAKYSTAYVEDFAKNNSKTALGPDDGNNVAILAKTASFLQEQIMALFSYQTAYAAENVQQPVADEIKMIFTTEQALSYTFGGLTKELVVDDVLERLNNIGIKATFFVAEIEMKKYPQTLRKIIANGHEIGIAIRPKAGESFDETRKSIIRSSRILKEQFGVSTNLVKQLTGAVSDTTKEAVGSLECKLIGQSINIVQTKHKEYTSADKIMAEIFRKSMVSLARGQIIYFKMDFYTDDQIIGGLMESIKQSKIDNIAYATFYDNPINNRANNSQFTIKPVGELLNNTKFIYQYPVDLQKVPPHVRTDGPEIAIDSHNFLSETAKRYIGHKNVNIEDRMIGFSKMDERRLDKSGYVHTKDNVIFFTFDDWGSDAAINKLLYILRKHNVPGTFFILTNNVLNNPNLLRTIAQEGHEIASHSDKHKPMAVLDPKTNHYVKTQDKEEYLKDLATSYQKLRDVIGDVTFNGQPVLTRFFRPPTLAVSKMGAETLFETGYEYIISGSTSTNDYQAKNVTEIVEALKGGVYTNDGEVQKGAILVMHMTDGSVYTPIALDILLTANTAKADSDPSKFKVGRLSDYLIEGYSQINRKKTLRTLHSSVNIGK
ncbi:polysaccharide deacetylase family protein [Sporomusa malonica]|uniref:Polysaccharide deacetylase n=1 Tax=Sporomusa malonica TaxID=112901 RepID=A0A1W2CN41_9FIRM|nr:polysaccharide deacetylase family protein [Sporomusa malonica]SMC86667.1 Polysaccharide deacetylase [Sporomusa malonica]